MMQKIIDYFKQYIGVISIVLALCILLTYSLSYFKVNIDNKRAAEMYIGELKYSMTIEGNSTNTLSVPAGETIVDVNITNQNGVDTYFKLLYLKNDNVTISYYDETKDTSEAFTKYLSSGELLEKGITGTLKLKIINNSSSAQTLTFSVSGGYSTNKLTDVDVPSSYSEITTMETTSSNTYFCDTLTSDPLSQGTKYTDGQYTYRYKQEGAYSSTTDLAWNNISDGWGVQLTDKSSTDPVTSKVCTYINNKPVISMSCTFNGSKATTLDVSSFDTSNVKNMSLMFYNSQATTLDLSSFNTSNVTYMDSMFESSQATTLDLSSFNTSNVTDMSYMFAYSQNLKTIYVSNNFITNNVTSSTDMFKEATNLVGGNGTKYNSSYLDKTYARIDKSGTPGYFTKNYNFATDSWDTIAANVRAGEGSNYTVGDTKEIYLGEFGTHTLRIANTSTPSECSISGFSQTACGFVLEFTDIITTQSMNTQNTNVGGWPGSEMYTFISDYIYTLLPDDLREVIIDTTVVSGHGEIENTNFTSTDKLYLLSPKEVIINWEADDTSLNLTRQLDYYANQFTTISNFSAAQKNIIESSQTIAEAWWLRSADSNDSQIFYNISKNGNADSGRAMGSYGVSPAFRIG